MSIDGLYLHIPFCRRRCGYCDFATWAGKEDLVAPYLKALGQEIRRFSGRPRTVFVGGGTPSLLEPDQWRMLGRDLNAAFDLSSVEEFTIEANPESVTREKLSAMREIGVDRISLGLQTTDDLLLERLERLHTWNDFLRAFEAVRASGFSNVNVDLMYGLPGQTMTLWEKSVEEVIALEPEHLSCYGLAVEPKTPFHAQGIRVDEELFADMYEWLLLRLGRSEWEHYEISNWAKPDLRSKHNLLYWSGANVLGLGVSAASFIDGERTKNTESLQRYLEIMGSGGDPCQERERLVGRSKAGERLMLGLRVCDGVEVGAQEKEDFAPEIRELETAGLLQHQAGKLRLTPRGYLLSNHVFRTFL